MELAHKAIMIKVPLIKMWHSTIRIQVITTNFFLFSRIYKYFISVKSLCVSGNPQMLPWTPRRAEFTRNRNALTLMTESGQRAVSLGANEAHGNETCSGRSYDTVYSKQDTDDTPKVIESSMLYLVYLI